MLFQRTCLCRLEPMTEQGALLAQTAGACRALCNIALVPRKTTAKTKVSRLHAKTAGARRDVVHQRSTLGGTRIEVPPQHASQMRAELGVIDKAGRKSQSQFVYTARGRAENADTNAARDLLGAVFARGSSHAGGRKQELPKEQTDV